MLGRVDARSDRAVFRQIADQLRSAVECGELGDGERLPSEAKLMEHYGVARGTIRQAIQLLQSEGIAIAEHGRGVFVRPRPPVHRLASDRFARARREQGQAAFLAESADLGRVPSVDNIEVAEVQPPADVAERLKVGPGQLVVRRSRRYLHDGTPVSYAISYVPASIARGTAIGEVNTGPGGIYARIEEAGYRLSRFTEEVAARMPTEEGEAALLTLPPGVPVLELTRVAYAEGDVPVEVCLNVMAADRFVLDYELPAA